MLSNAVPLMFCFHYHEFDCQCYQCWRLAHHNLGSERVSEKITIRRIRLKKESMSEKLMPFNTDLYIKNTSLEIRSVGREDDGLYRCSASNLEGKTDSNDLALDIHCKSHYRQRLRRSHDLCRIARERHKSHAIV